MKIRHCPACRRQWEVGDDVEEFFHRCPKGGPRQRFSSYRDTTREELLARDRMEWARSQLGAAVEDAIPEEQRLRRLA